MNKKITFLSLLSTLLVLPSISIAQPPGQIPGNILNLITGVALLVFDILWVVAAVFIVVMFVLAGFKYLTAQGDPSKVNEANRAVAWGAGGVIVIILAWSITGILRTTLGV